jgi:RNA polymerase sigma-70 factor (ECF subfamily)
MIQEIADRPEDEQEAFGLMPINGISEVEAAKVLGVSRKTLQRRLNHALMILTKELDGVVPAGEVPRQP